MGRSLLLPAWLFLASSAAAGTIDFARDVRPILARHCTACHGSAKQRAGLRLDSTAGALRGGDSGPVVRPGDARASKLLDAVTGQGDTPAMPPKGPRLEAREIALLRGWIDQGARPPAGEIEAAVERSKHWAFVPPERPALPVVRAEAWVRTPIDRFVLARLESRGLVPSPEADRVTLLRRLSLDLTGLPPTPEEVDAFVADTGPDAYERQVDRLLASPHHGERWGRHWLDAARYADSNGYNFDAPRSIWKYRDWVLDAFNRDKPFDEFIVEQLAGDLLPGAALSERIATGFHRNSMFNDEGGTDPEQSRDEGLVDRVNTTGTVFLGLTIGCAQCHDHKYDPVTQREYFSLYAFFNGADDVVLDCADPRDVARRDAHRARIQAVQDDKDRWGALLAYLHLFHDVSTPADVRKKVRQALAIPAGKRKEGMRQVLDTFFAGRDERYRRLRDTVAALRKQEPRFITTLALASARKPRETFVHVRGDFLRLGARVGPGVPRSLPSLSVAAGTTATRLDLARWIANPRNPLTARVAMNRLWQQYFGLGLVETENDFGTQGTPPSHPELLDWLAVEFAAARHWGLKAMHRLIVTSATYRQSSRYRTDLAEVDPRNRLLGRQNRLRLEAEIVRDAALASSGLLTRVVGGPSVFHRNRRASTPSRSPKNWRADQGPSRYRRGLYVHFYRSMPYPALKVFDSGDATVACTRRSRSTTPLQALTLANDQAFHECAAALAARFLREVPGDDRTRLRRAFQLCVAREPDAEELALLMETVSRQRGSAECAALPSSERERAAWTLLARALLNLDEFITRE